MFSRDDVFKGANDGLAVADRLLLGCWTVSVSVPCEVEAA